MKKRTTLRDIARVAKVHFTTVGLVLRGDSRPDPKTAARIIAIAKRMDYRPDPMLSALADYRSKGRRVYHGNIGYVFTTPLKAAPAGSRTAYLSAREHADRMGFQVESFEYLGPSRAGAWERMLHTRGIQSLILSPLPHSGPFPELDWKKYAVATIGQSITSPQFHRGCHHQSHSIRLQLQRLGELGYRRIGLVLSRNATVRTEHNFLGGFMAERFFERPRDYVDPLFYDGVDRPALAAWLKRHRPDAIIASEPQIFDELTSLGCAIPERLGFAMVAHRPERPELAGPIEDWKGLGEVAVDIVISLLAKRDYGIPASPRTTLVENLEWHPGATLRA